MVGYFTRFPSCLSNFELEANNTHASSRCRHWRSRQVLDLPEELYSCPFWISVPFPSLPHNPYWVLTAPVVLIITFSEWTLGPFNWLSHKPLAT
jgi:hypothetical protein